MRIIREIKVGERTVLVRELTVAELRAWMGGQQIDVDLVDALFEDMDLSLADIPVFSDLTADEVGGLAPSQIEPVAELIHEVNQRFFGIWQRRLAEARQSMAGLPASHEPSLF